MPWHLQAEWQEVSELIRKATEELDAIDKLYREAILARLSFGISINDSEAWEEVKEARNQAQKCLIAAIEMRHNFTRKVNGES